MKKAQIKIKAEQQDDGMWLVEMLGESGLLAWGDTREEAIENLHFQVSLLGSDGLRPQTSSRDFSRDDLPNKIHMVLCALVPVVIFFLALFVFRLSAPIAAALCFFSGIAAMFVLIPVTALIYGGIAKLKYGEVPRNARLQSTDAGCSSLVFVIIFLIMFGAMGQLRREREEGFQKPKTLRQK